MGFAGGTVEPAEADELNGFGPGFGGGVSEADFAKDIGDEAGFSFFDGGYAGGDAFVGARPIAESDFEARAIGVRGASDEIRPAGGGGGGAFGVEPVDFGIFPAGEEFIEQSPMRLSFASSDIHCQKKTSLHVSFSVAPCAITFSKPDGGLKNAFS